MGILRRLWKVIGGIVVGVNLVVNVVPLVWKLKIRIWDSVFLGLIVTLLLLVGLLASELEKHEKQEPEKANWPKLKFNEEILYVMNLVAGHKESKMERSLLATWYMRTFKEKNVADYNVLISKLDARGYFDTREVYPVEKCRITDEGFEYYDRHKSRKRWKNKLTKLSPPSSEKITTGTQAGNT